MRTAIENMSAEAIVTIVGAGPVGLTFANLLGSYGIPTLLIEGNLTTVKWPRAVSIDDESLRTLQIAGLSACVQEICAMDYGSIYLDSNRQSFASVSPSAAEYGYPRRNAFSQPELEALLAAALNRFPHLQTRFGHEVVGIEQEGGEVVLEVERQDGSRYRQKSRFVAACDGGRSAIRRMLDIGMEGTTYEKKWLIIDLAGTADNFRQTRVYCDPRRPGINLPGPNRSRRFEFMLLDGETDEQVTAPDFVRKLLHDHGPDENAEIVRKQVYTFHARKATRWRQGSVFLLGDAAHLTPPFAGQGLNSGLRDAANLAWKLAAVVRGQTGTGVLDSYDQERPEHAWQLIEMAIGLGRIMMPGTALKARLIQAGFRALRLLPPVNDYITQMRYKPKPRFSTGFFVPDGASTKRTRVGRMIPQPRVETEDRKSHLLDEILGPGFALIAVHSDPSLAFDGLPHLPFEERLGLRRVCITPRFWNPWPSTGGPVAVRDMQGDFLRHCPDAEGLWLLVRPDRYVLAAIPRKGGAPLVELVELVARLDRMFMN